MILTAVLQAGAQDAAIEERVSKLNGYVQDLREAQEAQRKQIEQLAKEISNLREQISDSKPNTASQEDLRKLADKIQEVDDKRKADNELIVKEIEALGKSAARARKPPETAVPDVTSKPSGSEKGYPYEIKSGDTLTAIVAAYREQGIKVTVDDILKANPGLKATSLQPGQKIFIPAPPQ